MRKVPNVISDKPKISYRELSQERPSDLRKFYGISERGMQVEINKHCGDATKLQQKKVYEEIYGHGTKRKD